MPDRRKLVLIGSGIKTIAHLTHEAETYIKHAECVLYLLNEPTIAKYIERLNPHTESLEPYYFESEDRTQAYKAISERILEKSKQHTYLCVVLYGHPTLFSSPGLDAITKAQLNGTETLILPGISAEDCLFSDLQLDPGHNGCFSIEATELLIRLHSIPKHSHVIIWQVAMLASLSHTKTTNNHPAMSLLLERLLEEYSNQHELTIYEAAIYPGLQPRVQMFKLKDLLKQDFTTISTLYIPPAKKAPINKELLHKLQLDIT